MGQLIYIHSTPVELEDRTLAHLQLPVTAKLRRSETSCTPGTEIPPTEAAANRCRSPLPHQSSSGTDEENALL